MKSRQADRGSRHCGLALPLGPLGRDSLLHEPSLPAPLHEVLLSKGSGFFRSDYVVANFLLPR
jgi:hypothetical protein